ncbi:MAG: glycosyltransferase family 39 protein [bacterium]
MFSVGPALCWFPFYGIVYLIACVRGVFIPSQQLSGYEFPFLLTVSSVSLLAGFIGVLCCFELLFFAVGKRFALLATSLILLSTPLLQYLFDEMNYAHVFSFLFSSLFLLFWYRFSKQQSTTKYFFQGCLIGVLCLMRWQQIIFLVFPLFELLSNNRQHLKDKLKKILICFVGVITFFLPQMVAWKFTFGKWLLIPQGEGFVSLSHAFSLQNNQLLLFLFSSFHGLFYWHPIFIVSFVGLVLYSFKEPKYGLPLLVVAALEVLLLSSVVDWWAGSSFGARRIVDSLPLFAVGLGYFFQHYFSRKQYLFPFVVCVGAFFSLWNCILWLQYLTVLSHDGELNIFQMFRNCRYLHREFLDVIRRSSFFSFIIEGAFDKAVFLGLVYFVIVVFGLFFSTILQTWFVSMSNYKGKKL